jgi:hypothetical protein
MWHERERREMRILMGKPGGRISASLVALRVDGRIILKWIFMKWDGGAWTGFIWFRLETGGCSCECGNEPSGSIKRGEFLD